MKVIGIGDNVVDRYVNRRIMFPGGNAVNFAVYASQCGAQAAYLGLIAADTEGRLIRSSLEKLGIDVSHAPLHMALATECCDVTLEDGDRVFIDSSWGEGIIQPLILLEDHLDYLKGFDVIHCGCYADMAAEMKKLDGMPAVKTYDFSEEPEFRTDEYLGQVLPFIDIALFSGARMDEEERIRIREKAVALGADLVLITDGARGQSLWDGEREHPGQVKMVEAIDTMGAGDSFFTAFVLGLVGRGYRRGVRLPEEMIRGAFSEAAEFSAKTCLVEGAFGFGTAY